MNVGKDISNDVVAFKLVISSLSKLLVIEREILHVSDETNYEGTNYMMSDFIEEQKKQFGC